MPPIGDGRVQDVTVDLGSPPVITVRALGAADADWRDEQLRTAWGSTAVARLGELVDVAGLDGLVAEIGDRRAGLLTYRVVGDEVEVVSIQTDPNTVGVGRALMDEAARLATARGARRLWLVTTDSNVRALGFYQRWGMRVAAIHADGVARARVLKPSIPLAGEHGVPLRDEIELPLPRSGGPHGPLTACVRRSSAVAYRRAMRRRANGQTASSRDRGRQTLMLRWLGMLSGRHLGPMRRAAMWASFVVVATGILVVWDYVLVRYPGIGDDRSIDVQAAPEWLVWLGLGLVAVGIAAYVVAVLTASHEEASSPAVPVSGARWPAMLAGGSVGRHCRGDLVRRRPAQRAAWAHGRSQRTHAPRRSGRRGAGRPVTNRLLIEAGES